MDNNEEIEKYYELIHDMLLDKYSFNFYFASLISESATKEECLKKLEHLEMLKEYFMRNNNNENGWLKRIEFAKKIIFCELESFTD